jgi:hypothetical protein
LYSSPQVDLAILFDISDGRDEVEVLRIEGLAQIGGDGDDGAEGDGAGVDRDFGRFEEADCVRLISLACV